MPFDPVFDDVYAVIKMSSESAIEGESVTTLRLDEIRRPGKISEDLIHEIATSTFCVADISGDNANVMWEVGYAMALGKPIVFIRQGVSDIPFDIRDFRIINYSRESLYTTLSSILRESIRDTLGHHQVERIDHLASTDNRHYRTIAVTGSTSADIERARARVPHILNPYIAPGVQWLCGSVGVIDETALKLLINREQKVTVIGYHAYDISNRVKNLIQEHRIPFVDAKREALPKFIDAPTERDLLFLTKADLQIILWDGESPGTRRLIDWFQSGGRDFVVGFI